VLRSENLSSVDELIWRLESPGPGDMLSEEVLSALTTHDTSFFRGAEAFRALREEVLPELRARRAPGERVRIWCAACSTGQEPYSVAMLARELGWTGRDVEILATDISERAVAQARLGIYSQMEVIRGLSNTDLARHFLKDGRHWRVRPELAELIRFGAHNLVREPAPEAGLDLILCRNVMMYFDPGTRATLERGLAASLRPGGCLLLGAEEAPEETSGLGPSPLSPSTPFYTPGKRAA
jgi:chemotaxis protein methyltransferase CheR